MIHRIFTVHDCKAEAYLPPFYFSTVGQAIRTFSDMVADPQHAFARHPEDYTLFQLGLYDDSTCSFDILPSPTAIGKAIEFINGETS